MWSEQDGGRFSELESMSIKLESDTYEHRYKTTNKRLVPQTPQYIKKKKKTHHALI